MEMKCGIEIHNRLNTRKKLFCGCRPRMSEKDPTGTIIRRLRAVPGEQGEIDPAAMYEFFRKREFEYMTYEDETCLVEMDEEPPHSLNMEALEVSLQVAKMLKAEIPDEIHVMRKTVIDGSNTSGFQRTAIVGMNGLLETSEGPVRISNISLEEESAQILGAEGNKVTYGLDRLGIPLIEIGTEPDIKSPSQAREVAEKLGMLIKSTGKSQTGIGRIRQDVNVSVKGGARIEIKGLQDIRIMERVIELEIQRQKSLLEIRGELKRRKASVTGIMDVTNIFRDTRNRLIKRVMNQGGLVLAFCLKGFGGLMKREVCEGKHFGAELTDYAKAYGLGGLIHSDEDLKNYGIEKEMDLLRKRFNAGKDDVVVVMAGDEEHVGGAAEAVASRAEYALKGVPKETRCANPDGTTCYMRPLPGESRMYPETDIPPIRITESFLRSIKTPEPLDAKANRFIKDFDLSQDLANEIVKSDYLDIFEEIAPKTREPKKVAELLTRTLKELKRKGIDTESLNLEDLESLSEMFGNHEIPREAIPDIITKMSKGELLKSILSSMKKLARDELESLIDRIIQRNIDLVKREGTNSFKKLMGDVMSEVRGRISGSIVADVLRERIEKAIKND